MLDRGNFIPFKVISGRGTTIIIIYSVQGTPLRNPSKLLQITLGIKKLLFHYTNLESYGNH